MDIIQEKNKIIIQDIRDFDVNHIFECGQCFRWNKEEDGSYTGVVKNKVINVFQDGTRVEFNNIGDYETIKEYFDLDTDYGAVNLKLRPNHASHQIRLRHKNLKAR